MLEFLIDAEQIHEGPRSVVYRGRDREGVSLIVKVIREAYPSRRRLAAARREHRLLGRIDSPRVPRTLGLVTDGNRLALKLADRGSAALSQVWDLGQPMPLDRFFPLAIDLADALRDVHSARIVHKDIKPSNIVVHPESGRAQLIDFDIASELPQEERSPLPPERIEGSLPYVSPEQTGRMNRPLDLRSDFYSLGVTFFQLLTGRLPFTSEDTVELIHAHLAVSPPALAGLRDGLPPALCDLVHTLLAKQAEDRYQSAWGLAADLKRLHAAWAEGVEPTAPLRSDDVPETFRLSRRLYGREGAVLALEEAFERSAAGQAELVLVAGISGVGKSSLIDEVHRALASRSGAFVEGKFDQLRRSVPYESLAEALRDLFRQILAEPPERLALWQRRLAKALGGGAQVLVDVIPELELVLGAQPPAPSLAPAEALNRLGLLFQRLFSVFARPEHRLVLFLDDLQWADRASLRLLEVLLADPARRGLLVVGAYRDNEVGPSHPLTESLSRLGAAGTPTTYLELGPLTGGDVAQLLADSFGTEPAEGAELATLLVDKTGGNPFFLGRFLHALHDQGLLAREPGRGRWGWDVAAIEEHAITDNVVDLVTGRLRGLPRDAQDVLPLGASLGARFSLADLSAVAQRSPGDTALALWPAVQAGLLLPLEQDHRLIPALVEEGGEELALSFRFLHDRVQQAAWALLPAERHRATHLRVGRRLLESLDESGARRRLFDVVGHLNAAAALLEEPEEIQRVVELNLQAGERARKSGAYSVAADLLEAGLSLVSRLPDSRTGELTPALHLHRGAVTSQLGQSDVAAVHFAEALRLATDSEWRVRVHIEWCLGLLYDGDHFAVMRRGILALAELGVVMPSTPEARQKEGLGIMQEALEGLTPETIGGLADLPAMTDQRSALIAEVIAVISPSAYITNAAESCFLWISFQGLKLVRASGNAVGSCHGHSLVGMTLCAIGDVDRGIAFHRLAVALADRLDDLVQKLRTLTCLGFQQPWRESPRDCVRTAHEAFACSLDGGDWFHAQYAAANALRSGLYGGLPLEDLAVDAAAYADFMLPHGLELGPLVSAVHTVQARLRAGQPASGGFDAEWLAEVKEFFSEAARVWPLMVSCFAAVVDDDAARAAELADAAWVGFVDCRNFGDGGELNFLHGFAAIRLGQAELAAKQLAGLEVWAAGAPQTYGAKALCLRAGIAGLAGDDGRALALWTEAVQAARLAENPVVEALASEVLAQLQSDRGFEHYAHLHALDAAHAWKRWGAPGLAARVGRRWPDAARSLAAAADSETRSNTGWTDTITDGAGLDLRTALRAAEALAGEVELPALMRQLLQLASRNAGADAAALLLAEGDTLHVRARWTSDPEQFELASVPLDEAKRLPLVALRLTQRLGEPLVVNDALLDPRFSRDEHVVATGVRSLMVLPLVRRGEAIGVVVLENRLAARVFTPQRVQPLTLLSAQMAVALENARLIEQIRRSLEQVSALSASYQRFVPEEVLALLGKESILDVGVGDRVERPVAVLFSDIRGFTSMSERLGGIATFDFLNRYLGRVAPLVRASGGFIDKYVGDAMMALFPGGAADAYRAALAIQREVDAMNHDRAATGLAPFGVGIGLHLGDAVMGTVGEPERMEGTVISDAVNTGSRLEGLCKDYDARIVASRVFVEAVGTDVPVRELGSVTLKGRSEPIDALELLLSAR